MNGHKANGMSGKEMAAEMIAATKEYFARALKPYEDRIAELERRAPIPGKDGRDGKDGIGRDGKDGKDGVSVDFDSVVDAVAKRIPVPKDGRDGVDGKNGHDGINGDPGKDGKDGANGFNGKDADPAEVERLVIGYVQKAVGGLPVPRDGRDGRDGASVSVEAVEALVRAEVAKAVSVIPAGKDGKDAVPVDVNAVISEVVKRVPVPRDGKDADPIDTDRVIAEVVKRVPIPKDGKDGPSLSEVREMLMSFAQGYLSETVKLLPVPKDGKSVTIEDVTPLLEGEVAKWELAFERRAFDKLQKAIDRLPVPKDGEPGRDGKDGADGFGFDDFDIEYDGERMFTFKWSNAERQMSKTFKAPIPLYREVWKSSEVYEKGDVVTYGGAQWTAIKDDLGTPGEPDCGWRLSVKSGQGKK